MSWANPTRDELADWARTDSSWPLEDWDLVLSWTGEITLWSELASRTDLPQHAFFLRVLYVFVGRHL